MIFPIGNNGNTISFFQFSNYLIRGYFFTIPANPMMNIVTCVVGKVVGYEMERFALEGCFHRGNETASVLTLCRETVISFLYIRCTSQHFHRRICHGIVSQCFASEHFLSCVARVVYMPFSLSKFFNFLK